MAIIKFDELQDLYNRAGGEVPDLIEYLQEIDMKERKEKCEKLLNTIIESAQKILEIIPTASMLIETHDFNGNLVDQDILGHLASIQFDFTAE